MLNIIVESEEGVTIFTQTVSNGAVIGFLLFIAAFYVLRSIGIYKLAKNQGIEKAYIAFIPCVWMFTACKIIGKARIFGYTAEKLALGACIVFSAAAIIPLAYNFLVYFPYIMYYLQGGEVSLISRGSLYIDTGSDFINHFDTPAVNVISRILLVLRYILNIAEIFITVTVYIALFRKFWPEHYILASVLSFFGLFPIFVFAIRNRKAVDFNEYLRRRFYGSGYTPYGPYGGYRGQGGANNPYGAPQGGGFSDGKDEPFGEFSNRPDEPFGEFDGGTENRGDNDNDNSSGNNSDDYYQ